ncbi:MAG: 3-phosphoshikimate 1-carboxyvinyltransferase [Candidatus Handelsmanbacteria bacterium]|nr:3-phosphoshikimate 1-carboxyvinyltransferase [Candidatus Handelsmanbacteria bacterium]
MKAHIHYTERLSGRLDPPSSKNYTTRYLLAAALAEGESVVHFPAHSDDGEAMRRCLAGFGAQLREERGAQGRTHLHIRGFGRHPANPGVVDPGNAGAVLRLLMGVGALLPEVRFETRFAESLGQRPHGDLLAALEQLGAQTESEGGRLPLTLRRHQLRGGRVRVSGARSSQYLSALLFLAPLIGEAVEIEVIDHLVSQPLIRTTLEVLAQAGIQVEAAADLLHFRFPAGQHYQPREYTVNGDYPSSAAILAAGAVTNSPIAVDRLFEDCQGERAVIPLLRQMGVAVEYDGRSAALLGHQGLRAVDFDGDTATDMVLAMSGAAAFAEGESRFHGIANLRLKECDRISVPVRELRRLGVDCAEGPAEILVRGNPEGYEGGVEVPTYHDHRVAQLLTIVGLRCRRGLTVLDAETVGKSYPAFFQDLIGLGARIELVE